ncbi:hypothetical protein [Streptomyces sp. NPDC005336]|uniref:hypothetical protein n=1 Tax=unclassified Streptomyces TaxID=2593676 RepID=UPI0033BCF15B
MEEYEQLIASRRQIGGQSARVRVLAQQAKRTERLLQDLKTLIATPPASCPEQGRTVPTACAASCPPQEARAEDADAGCLRCAIAALLRHHREPVS